MKKSTLLLSSLALSTSLMANSSTTANEGHVILESRLHFITSGRDGTFDPRSGSALWLHTGYQTRSYNGFDFRLTAGGTFDLNYTRDNQYAKGLFMRDATLSQQDATKEYVRLGEAVVRYKSEGFMIKAGQWTLNSPMTQEAYTTTPNLHRALYATYKFDEKTTLIGSYIHEMAYGARALTSFSLIGEKTTTSGATSLASKHRGTFFNMGALAYANSTDGSNDNSGLKIVGLETTAIPYTTLQMWDYHATDVANTFYADFSTKYPLDNGAKLLLGAQYIYQNGQMPNNEETRAIYGAKIGIANNGLTLLAATNRSNSNALINPYGGDPAYTSSIFSRNEYRANVDAYKLTAKYKVPKLYGAYPKNLSLIATYADYGKSDTAIPGFTTKTNDATERDLVLLCKPTKKFTIKLFNALRTTETNRRQDHTRVVLSYKF
jgi:hypothetical protein